MKGSTGIFRGTSWEARTAGLEATRDRLLMKKAVARGGVAMQ
jgi:hypothetical protein